jgi:hypothetical protein
MVVTLAGGIILALMIVNMGRVLVPLFSLAAFLAIAGIILALAGG